MTAQTGASAAVTPANPTVDTSRLYQEGIVAGILGAAVVAIWFLILDTLNGRPLYTPTVLGTALFRRGASLGSSAVSLDMVLMFTWVHGMVFAVLGGVAARLLGVIERHPGLGFGIVLLFVVFTACFTFAAMLFASPVLQALTWPAIFVANLLAAATMAGYLRLRHRALRVSP